MFIIARVSAPTSAFICDRGYETGFRACAKLFKTEASARTYIAKKCAVPQNWTVVAR